MRKFTDKINESEDKYSVNSLSDESLKQRLDFLRLELEETQNEIRSIVQIIKSREDARSNDFFKTLPKNIFDLNKEQLEYILHYDHGTNEYRYKESRKYWDQLFGFYQNGTLESQASFCITLSAFEVNDKFQYNDLFEKSFKLLKDNLIECRFSILGNYDDNSYNLFVLVNDDNIEIYDRSNPVKDFLISELEELIKYLYDRDLSYKDDDDYL